MQLEVWVRAESERLRFWWLDLPVLVFLTVVAVFVAVCAVSHV